MSTQHAGQHAQQATGLAARRFRMLGTTLFIALVASLLGPVSPAAATTGAINGRLQVTTPGPVEDIAGATVEIYTLGETLVTSFTTDAEGRFLWSPAPAGDYKIFFQTNNPDYLDLWYPNEFTFNGGAVVTVVAGETFTFGVGTARSSRIVGSATDPTLFENLPGAEVQVYRSDGTLAATTVTDGFGQFVVRGLFPNLYRVAIRPVTGGYARQFWPNATFIEQATFINLSGAYGQIATGIDMEFAAGGSVSGTASITYPPGLADGLSVEVFNERDELVSTGVTDVSGQYLVAGLRSGDHYVRFGGVALSPYRTVYSGGASTAGAAERFAAVQGSEVPDLDILVQLVDPVIERIAGGDRYSTAVAVTSGFDPGIPVLYIATGTGFADALSAASAAVSLGGALLLTDPAYLPTIVADEIERLAPDEVIVVGGTGVVSASVYAQIAGLIPDTSEIRRVFGADRYATSRTIAIDAFGSSASTEAYVADGRNFPDALVASVPAGLVDAPVILVNGSAPSVDAATTTLLGALGITTVTIVGGTGAVSDGIRTSIDALPAITDVGRRSGADRYATAVAVNLDVPAGPTAYLATGSGFADALAGAALAGSQAAPIFLVRTTCVPAAVLAKLDELAPVRMVLLGGTGVLTPAVAALTSC